MNCHIRRSYEDYTAQISLVDRSPETARLKAHLAEQQRLYQLQCKTILENVSLIERQRQTIKDFQDEMGIDNVETLKNNLLYANKRIEYGEEEIKKLRTQINNYQSIADNRL